MRLILIFAPYILVPLLVTILFKWFEFSWKWLTFVLTAALIFFYPFGLFWLDGYINPPTPGPRCGMLEMSFFLGNTFIFLPTSLLLQFVFNKFLLTIKNIPNDSVDTIENKLSKPKDAD